MTPFDLRAALAEFNMSAYAFNNEFGLSHDTAQRWVRGARPVPEWVDVVFELKRQIRFLEGE